MGSGALQSNPRLDLFTDDGSQATVQGTEQPICDISVFIVIPNIPRLAPTHTSLTPGPNWSLLGPLPALCRPEKNVIWVFPRLLGFAPRENVVLFHPKDFPNCGHNLKTIHTMYSDHNSFRKKRN